MHVTPMHHMHMATPGRRPKTADAPGVPRPYADVGGRVRWLREQKGLGQTELAHLIGMSNTNLWKIEAGQILPTLENLHLLRQHLGSDEAFMLFGAPMVDRERAHERLMARYAAEKKWSPKTADLLSHLPWELLGVAGAPSLADAERMLMTIEANRALSGKGAKR
jgi:transcriptional regulator with XRE-family HTH domain